MIQQYIYISLVPVVPGPLGPVVPACSMANFLQKQLFPNLLTQQLEQQENTTETS